ncbi:hypothetical protein [Pseudomonas sp. T1.Ur]|uniref:hypothetical protein n=1 Tax=Pseudomonas sp. T1.Ur TaxID=2928704 RepID=UPI00201D2EAF|nr:hypothetical protein [Pseudomonas sp. T1.Ur]MCL6703290.1 hypothetical protein [Pseudomonas sp. T1.Ur]
MSKMSLSQLVGAMQGKSLTYGWDALTLYDQRKANELLFQLYIERFNTEDGYIEPLSIVAKWGDDSYKEHIYNLKLSAPRLSFESSDPSLAARARLTMDMIGGMIVSTKEHAGVRYVSKMLQVLPIGGPQLWMDQPVTKGVVTGLGDVVIDLNNADTFMANFVIGSLAQEQVGRRFQEYFENNLLPEQKFFSLGSLEGDLNGVLTPKNFEIRTMKSDPTALFGDENYGDGAVMMFITLQDGQDGITFPNKNAPYLIPADGNGARFTGAMLLSSRVLAEKVLKPALQSSIGNGLVLTVDDQGQDNASTLVATAGGGSARYEVRYKYWQGGAGWGYENDATSTLDPFPYDFTGGSNVNAGLKVDFGEGGLTIDISWAGTISGRCTVQTQNISGPDVIDFHCSHDVGVRFEVSLDKVTNYVELNNPEVVGDVTGVTFSSHPIVPWNMDGEAATRNLIIESVRSLIRGTLDKIELPSIDTFLLRNLLFPGHNALHLTEAFVPGDLAVFGEIDPLRTTTVMAPLNSTIEAGSTLQFSLKPMPANVQWSVRDVDGENTTPGAISASGLYTAPSQAQLPNGFVAVIVTAQGTLDGQPVQSSALVSVLHSTIQTNPLYASCDTGKTLELEGKPLGNGTLQWTILTPQWGSTLTAVAGKPDERLYTAGNNMDPAVPFPIDKIEIKNTANNTASYIYVTINKVLILVSMVLDESSDPETGTVQFKLEGDSGPLPVPVTWELLAGEGSVDEDGVYTEPETVAPGSFAVISGTADVGIKVYGITAIPLPLGKYAELIEAVSQTIRGS